MPNVKKIKQFLDAGNFASESAVNEAPGGGAHASYYRTGLPIKVVEGPPGETPPGAVLDLAFVTRERPTETVNALLESLNAYYKFDEGSGIIAFDSSPNGLDGLLKAGLPDSLAGLRVWYKADALPGLNDGDRVPSLIDSSGSGNDTDVPAVVNQAILRTNRLNGLPVIEFDPDGGGYILANLVLANNEYTYFVVLKSASTSAEGYLAYPNTTGKLSIEKIADNQEFNVNLKLDDASSFRIGSSGSVSATNFQILESSKTQAGLHRLHLNGAEIASVTPPSTFTLDSSGGVSFPGPANLEVAEIIIYDRALSDSERKLVEANLSSKYGLSIPNSLLLLPRFTTVVAPLNFSNLFAILFDSDERTSIAVKDDPTNKLGSLLGSAMSIATWFRLKTFCPAALVSKGEEATVAYSLAVRPDITLPDSIAGLELWLKADAITGLSDGDAVTAWTGSSANAHVADTIGTGTSPVFRAGAIGGKPAVAYNEDGGVGKFSSVTAGISLNGAGNNEYTMFWIGRIRRNVSFSEMFDYRILGLGGFQVQNFVTRARYKLGDGLGSAVNNSITTDIASLGAFVLEADKTAAGIELLRINGLVEGTLTSPFTVAANKEARIGAQGLQADVAEVIVYDRLLTDAERQKVEAYLSDKYGIALEVIISSTIVPCKLKAKVVTATGSVELESTSVIGFGTDHHGAVTYDGIDARLYFDGIQEAISPLTGSLTTVADALDFVIGTVGTIPGNGQVDDLRVYAKALSAAEVTALANGDNFFAGGAVSQFTLAKKPIAGSEEIFVGGVLKATPEDYIKQDGEQIVVFNAPITGIVQANYRFRPSENPS